MFKVLDLILQNQSLSTRGQQLLCELPGIAVDKDLVAFVHRQTLLS